MENDQSLKLLDIVCHGDGDGDSFSSGDAYACGHGYGEAESHGYLDCSGYGYGDNWHHPHSDCGIENCYGYGLGIGNYSGNLNTTGNNNAKVYSTYQ